MPYGNYSVSSLLSAARAAANKTASLNDSIAAYEFDLSPKDANAYQRYAGYLQGRLQSAQDMGDQSKVLDYSKKLTSAQRGYTSTEINRATTQVLYGNMSDSQKLQKMTDLYRQALENGDENLAQTVEMKAAMLQQQMQRYSGGFGGRGENNSTATKRGIDTNLKKLDISEKELKQEFATGKIKQDEYMSRLGQVYDARDQILGSTYTVNPDGTISTGKHPDLTDSQVMDYINKHESLQSNDTYNRLLGTNIKAPLEERLARQQSFISPSYDPTTGEVKLQNNKIVGLRRGIEFGSNLDFGISANNDTSGYNNALKSLGFKDAQNGVLGNKEFTDWNGNTLRADFYANDPNKPGYAYTQLGNGVRYALNPDGQVTMLGDSAAADKAVGALKDQLANGKITQQQYLDQIKGINSDLLPQSMQQAIATKQADSQAFGLAGVGRKLKAGATDLYKSASNGVGGFIDKLSGQKFAYDLGNQANDLAGKLGLGNLFTGSGIAGSLFGSLPGIGDLQNKVKGLQDQYATQQRQLAAQRQAEADAALRAIAASNAKPQVNYASGTVSGALGPRVIPGAAVQASQTPGTKEFNNRYAPSGFGGQSLYNKYL